MKWLEGIYLALSSQASFRRPFYLGSFLKNLIKINNLNLKNIIVYSDTIFSIGLYFVEINKNDKGGYLFNAKKEVAVDGT